MAKFHGVTVNGYATNGKGNDDYGMQVCGMLELGSLVYADRGPHSSWGNWLETLDNQFNYNKKCGNLLFAINSMQLNTPHGLVNFLLKHPNTQIIHHYKNNAHGPSCIFVCMHHRFPETIDRTVKNNVEEYKARHVFKVDNWYVKEVE